jgi:hypothetical protein
MAGMICGPWDGSLITAPAAYQLKKPKILTLHFYTSFSC